MQAFEQGQDFVAQHAWDQPFATLFVDLVQHEQRHGHGQTIARVAGFMQIQRTAIHPTQAYGFGEGIGGDAGGLVAHQLVAGQNQQLRLLPDFFAVPAFAAIAAAHIGRQLLIVERIDQLVVNQHILAPRLVFQVFHLCNQFAVGRKKWQRCFPLATDQGLADENIARRMWVHPRKIDAPSVVNHDAIQGGAFQRRNLGGLLFPMRIE